MKLITKASENWLRHHASNQRLLILLGVYPQVRSRLLQRRTYSWVQLWEHLGIELNYRSSRVVCW